MTTSWASFCADLAVDGCQLKLHLPCFGLAEVPGEMLIPFKPKPGKMAVLYLGRRLSSEDFTSGETPYVPVGDGDMGSFFG